MARYRFGEGQYRYFARPYPQAVAELKHALYPRLLPIARDWWRKLRRDPPWPDSLDEWLDICHRAGQTRTTALMLKYTAGGWCALHQDLYGELVFPLQVVINLTRPDIDYTGGEFLLYEQRPRAVPRYGDLHTARARAGDHHPRAAGAVQSWLGGRSGPPRGGVHPAHRITHDARTDLPRRVVTTLYTLNAADGQQYSSLTPGGRLGGHRRARIYGRLDCPSALRAIGGRPVCDAPGVLR